MPKFEVTIQDTCSISAVLTVDGQKTEEQAIAIAREELRLRVAAVQELYEACWTALDAIEALQDKKDGSLVSPARLALTMALNKADWGEPCPS